MHVQSIGHFRDGKKVTKIQELSYESMTQYDHKDSKKNYETVGACLLAGLVLGY